jgi:SAM-dependent methyltransferase
MIHSRYRTGDAAVEFVKTSLSRIPIIGSSLVKLGRRMSPRRQIPFQTSAQYWEDTYAAGGFSGPCDNRVATEFKSSFLNSFVQDHSITSVIEWGSGDGELLRHIRYRSYIGVDVSRSVVERCRRDYVHDVTKRFFALDEIRMDTNCCAELALSLDVIYHLVEDLVYHAYMVNLFASATRFVVISAWDVGTDQPVTGGHVRHRAFGKWVVQHAGNWKLVQVVENHKPIRPGSSSVSPIHVYELTNGR